jgi:cytochrome c-type biogenesis protein CcmE
MYGKKVKLRILFLSFIFLTIILTIFLVLKSLEANVVYFVSPTEIKNLAELDKKKVRVKIIVKKINYKNSILNLTFLPYMNYKIKF